MGATLTLVPVLLLAWWLVRGTSHLWRARVADEAGVDIASVASALGGRVTPRFAGFAVVAPGVRVDWRGGLAGLATRVKVGRRRRTEPGLLGADAVRGLVESLRA